MIYAKHHLKSHSDHHLQSHHLSNRGKERTPRPCGWTPTWPCVATWRMGQKPVVDFWV